MTSIAVLNGPNLNLLGTRSPEIYGSTTIDDVRELCRREIEAAGFEIDFRQSNHEGELIDWIHELGREAQAGRCLGAVYNPGAHTHYAHALRDAIEGAQLPVVEVHISNVHAREKFRHRSVVSPVAAGIVVGFGVAGYGLGIRGLIETTRR